MIIFAVSNIFAIIRNKAHKDLCKFIVIIVTYSNQTNSGNFAAILHLLLLWKYRSYRIE